MDDPSSRSREPESVWDYPRPPRVESTRRLVVVEFAGTAVAESRRSLRVLETSHPPAYYVPADDVRTDLLAPARGATVCEWKGVATYFDLVVGGRVSARAAWTYLEPSRSYEEIAGFLSFYPQRVDACFVDGERVRAQPGDFYGGWITDDVAGPFKGDPGSVGP